MSLCQQLKNRSLLFGAWTSLGHPSITEMFCKAPFHFVGIDMEHSTISLEQAQSIIATTQSFKIPCLPRVSSHNPEQVRRLLDSGADGVIVPMVSNPQELDAVVSWVKYPPVGKRGFGVARAQGYGWSFDENAKNWNKRGSILIQIESIEGVNQIENLLKNDELDGVMVGPYDLSGTMGIPGQLDHPHVQKACKKVIEACKKYGKACGTQIVDPDVTNVQKAIQEGYTFIILASDVFLLWKWGERMREIIRATSPLKEALTVDGKAG